ncbi:MAG: cytochrome-c oxidase, partial [Gemmatimonadales bacterium]|nr:cytochrome-c oxidase [Gemmatimonadales bacterium]
LISGSVWLCVGAVAGLFSAVQLFAPDVLRNIPVLQMGRVRPTHVNLMLLGFVGALLLGAGLYIVPVMLRTRLHGERLANLSVVLYNLALVGAVVTLPLGFT